MGHIVGSRPLLFWHGERVRIVAKGDFYAFVDGWEGVVTGLDSSGHYTVECHREDGTKTLYVPPDELVKL